MASSARIDELQKKFDENPRRYFAPLANEYRKAGQIDRAIALCREHLPKQPGHMSGHIVYGQALYEAGQPDEARRVFQTALDLDPENVIALRHMGDIDRAGGNVEDARRWYTRVLDADPRNPEVTALVDALDASASAAPTVAGPAWAPAPDAGEPSVLHPEEFEPGPEPTAEAAEINADLAGVAAGGGELTAAPDPVPTDGSASPDEPPVAVGDEAAWPFAEPLQAEPLELEPSTLGSTRDDAAIVDAGESLVERAPDDFASFHTATSDAPLELMTPGDAFIGERDEETAPSDARADAALAGLPLLDVPPADDEALAAYERDVAPPTPGAAFDDLPLGATVDAEELPALELPAAETSFDTVTEAPSASDVIPAAPAELEEPSFAPRAPTGEGAAAAVPGDELSELPPIDAFTYDETPPAVAAADPQLPPIDAFAYDDVESAGEPAPSASTADLDPVPASDDVVLPSIDAFVFEGPSIDEFAYDEPAPVAAMPLPEPEPVASEPSTIEQLPLEPVELEPAAEVAQPAVDEPLAGDELGADDSELVGVAAAAETRPEAEVAPPEPAREPAAGSPFVTETMAELYLRQGFRDEALGVYRQLLASDPYNTAISAKVRELTGEFASVMGTTPAAAAPAVQAPAPVADPAPQPASRPAAAAGTGSTSARAFFAALATRPGARAGRATTPRGVAAQPPAPPASGGVGFAAPDLDAFVEPASGAPGAGGAEAEQLQPIEAYGYDAERAGAPGGPAADPGSLDALFGGAPVRAEDRAAATALAAAFGAPAVTPSVATAAVRPTPARPTPARPSLDEIFRAARPPEAAPPRRATPTAFSFDQFFADETPPAAGGGPSGAAGVPAARVGEESTGDLEQFNSWLESLKRK